MFGGIKRSGCGILVVALAAQGVLAGDHHTLRFHYPDSRAPKVARSLAISPDGTELALCVDPGEVHFVRISDGELTGQRKGSPFAMKYSKDGSRIMIFSTDDPILLDIKTRKPLPIDTEDEPGFLGLRTIERNGKLLVDRLIDGGPAAKSGQLQVGDEITGVSNGKTSEFESTLGMSALQFTEKLQGPARTYVRVRVLRKGQNRAEPVLFQRQPGKLTDGNLQFKEAASPTIGDNLVPFQRDGRHSFLSAADGKTVAALNTEQVEHVGQFAISPNQRRFAVLSFTKADRRKFACEVFDLEKLERTLFFPFDRKSFNGLAFSADGKELLAVSRDRVDAFNSENGKFLRTYTLEGKLVTTFENEELSPKTEATTRSSRAAVAGAAADNVGPIRAPLPQRVERIAVSAKHLAIGAPNGTVSLWDYKTGAKVTSFELGERSNSYAPTKVQSLAFSQDGRWLVFYVDGVLNIVDVADREPETPDKP